MSEENNETPIDEESQKILDDLENNDKPTPTPAPVAETKKASPKKKAVKKRPASENIPADDDESLKQPVVSEQPAVQGTPAAVEQDEPETGRVLTNTSKNPRRIGGVTVPVGETYDLTDQDLDDDLLMKKINHSITQGALSRGAD